MHLLGWAYGCWWEETLDGGNSYDLSKALRAANDARTRRKTTFKSCTGRSHNIFPLLTYFYNSAVSIWESILAFCHQQVEFSSAHLQNDRICLIAFNPKMVYLHCGKKVHYKTDLHYSLQGAARFTASRIIQEMNPKPAILRTITDMNHHYLSCE